MPKAVLPHSIAAGAPPAANEPAQTDLPPPISTLAFGTNVRVTNHHNGKTVVVRIVDRGPYGRGRIIDVSRAAARELDMIGAGTAMDSIERQ